MSIDSKQARPRLPLLRYTIEAVSRPDLQSASSCESGRLVYAIQALLFCTIASVPGQAGTLHPCSRGLRLCDPYQLSQALSGAKALTWQLGTACMGSKKSNSVGDGHQASRSPAPADRSGVLPYMCKIAVLASRGSAPALHKLSLMKGGKMQVTSSG